MAFSQEQVLAEMLKNQQASIATPSPTAGPPQPIVQQPTFSQADVMRQMMLNKSPQPPAEYPGEIAQLGQVESVLEDLPKELKPPKAATPQEKVEHGAFIKDFYNWVAPKAKELVTGEGRKKKAGELPEFYKELFTGKLANVKGETDLGRLGNKAIAGIGLVLSPTDQGDIDIIENYFPGTKGKIDKEGVTVLTTPDKKKHYLNAPGMSAQDGIDVGVELAMFYGPFKFARLGQRGFLAKRGIEAVVGAGVQTGRELASQQFGSEVPLSPERIATAGALEAVGGAVADIPGALLKKRVLGQAGITGREAADITNESIRYLEASEEIIDKAGIDLFKYQQSGGLSGLTKQTYLTMAEGSSRQAGEALKRQNKQAYSAVNNFMDTIASPESVELASGRLKETALKAVQGLKARRSAATKPHYTKAFEDKKIIGLPETRKAFAEVRAKYGDSPEINRFINRIEPEVFGPAFLPAAGKNAEQIDFSKKALDKMYNKQRGENVLDDMERGILKDIKNTMLDEVDKINPSYKKARRVHRRMSKPIEKVVKGKIGRIAKLEEPQYRGIARALFDPVEGVTNPSVIRKAKQIISKEDPQAWRDIVRVEFERRLSMARTQGELGDFDTLENIPGKLKSAIFGNKQQREILYSGLDPETASTLKWIETGLGRASKGRPGESATQRLGEAAKEIDANVVGAFRNLFRDTRATLAGAGEEALKIRSRRALGRVVFDPEYRVNLKALKKLNPDSKAAKTGLEKLISDVSKTIQTAVKPAPFITEKTLGDE